MAGSGEESKDGEWCCSKVSGSCVPVMSSTVCAGVHDLGASISTMAQMEHVCIMIL